MRRLLTFECEGALLGGSLDEAEGTVGVLIVTGGSQTRIGSHRLFERIGKYLSANDYPAFRFDRRGVGDSSGEDPGFRGSGADIKAALASFREQVPEVEHVIGLGLCDGATALALNGLEAGISGVILVNPWLVEAEAGAPPPAAIRSHYRRRLLSREGWAKLLSGRVNLRKLAGGVRKAAGPNESSLAEEAALSLAVGDFPVALILATGDNTAIAAAAETRRPPFPELIAWSREIDTDSHTFAKPGDLEALQEAVLDTLSAIAQQP